MATSTLIQRLELGNDKDSNRSQSETFWASSAITKGDWVQFDTGVADAAKCVTVLSASVIPLGNALVCGVALNTVASGSKIGVCISGYCPYANVDGAVSGSVPLTVDTTAGRAHAAVASDLAICGVALADDVSNYAPVFVYKKF
jgi:hypothetical protein